MFLKRLFGMSEIDWGKYNDRAQLALQNNNMIKILLLPRTRRWVVLLTIAQNPRFYF